MGVEGYCFKIIVAEYFEDEANLFEGINDYKILCFDGKVEYFYVDRFKDHKISVDDIQRNNC